MTTPKAQIQSAIETLRGDMQGIIGSFGDLAAYERSPVAMLYHDLNGEVLMLGGAIAGVPDDATTRCYPIVECAKNMLKFMKPERLMILFGEEYYDAILEKYSTVLIAIAGHVVDLLDPIADKDCAMALADLKRMYGEVVGGLTIRGGGDA